MSDVTQAMVRKEFEYFSDTGVFMRIAGGRNTKIGHSNWTTGSTGYRKVMINGKTYQVHRLIWLYVHGYFPVEIDHINRVRTDNRLVNLRAVSGLQNHRNMPRYKSNTSGHMGVVWRPDANKWQAQIWYKNSTRYLGIFPDILSAIAIRRGAEWALGFHINHGKRISHAASSN